MAIKESLVTHYCSSHKMSLNIDDSNGKHNNMYSSTKDSLVSMNWTGIGETFAYDQKTCKTEIK